MTQWRVFTIRMLAVVFLLLLLLLITHVDAQGGDGSDGAEGWLLCDDRMGYCNHPDATEAPGEAYRGPLDTHFHEYYDDEAVAVDVDVEDEGEHEGREYEEIYHGSEFSLPHCPQEGSHEELERPVVVVSTLDGRITALDLLSGAVLWSHQTGGSSISQAMLSSSMSKLEVTSRGEWVRLIPSLDGGIFRFDGEGVEALPITADTLLHSSFKFNPDTIFTGAKVTEVWGVALGSGRVTYICHAGGCKRQNTASPTPSRLLVVRRVTQTVRAVDPKSGDERWNFSVGQHEVNLGAGGCESGGVKGEDAPALPSLHFVIPDGVIMGMDNQDTLLWQQKLTSPVVSAWRVKDGELEEVDLFSTSNIPALSPDKSLEETHNSRETQHQGSTERQPALYVGVHQKQLYIQQSSGMQHHSSAAAKVFTADSDGEDSLVPKYPRVQWRPYLASAPSRTPIVNYNTQQHPLLLSFEPREEPSTAVAITHHIDNPFDNGYYLYADENLGQVNLSRPWNRPEVDAGEVEENIMDEVTQQIIHICFHLGPDMWLKVGVMLCCYALIHYLLLRYMIKHMRRQLNRQALTLVTQMVHHILQNNPQILALVQRMGLQLHALPPPPPPPPPQKEEGKALPPSSPLSHEHTPQVERTDSSSTEYTSRYLTDFELVQCLGQGGFGVVCQVRNKLDENEYAVKRIVLPAKKSSAERVKREVRALAKLNHSNIVRYYNSWLETPPPGWQDHLDAYLKSGDVLSTSLLSPGTEESHNEMPGVADTERRAEECTDSLAGMLGHIGGGREVPNLSTDTWGSVDGENGKEDSTQSSSSSSASARSGDDCRRSGWSRDKGTEDSFDIVFENSQSSVGIGEQSPASLVKVSDGESESWFKGPKIDDTSQSTSRKLSNSSQERLSNDTWEKASKASQGRLFSDSQSDFVVFESMGKISFVEERNKSEANHVTNGEHQDCQAESQDQAGNSNRRRVMSQPEHNNIRAKGERPRTLSLGSRAATDMENAADGKTTLRSPVPRTFLYIQMELCQKESLRDWLVQNPHREQRVVLAMFNDITRAVEYVHDNHLMHRDLKPSNIFFSLDGEIKVGDFGLVTSIAEQEEQEAACTPATHMRAAFPDAGRTHTHRVGTRLYMSPEQLSSQVYDYKVDIYSLGLIFFEMLVPFGTGMERLQVMTTLREHTSFPPGFEERFPDESSLLKLMLSRDPACRPTTRGVRARNPLRPLQGRSVEDISPEDHFRLSRQRSHYTASSSNSLSTSSNTST